MDKGPTQYSVHTKMGADSSAENTPNNPGFICPSPKVLDFNEKRFHWVSVVRGLAYYTHRRMLHLKCLECLANAS